MILRAWRRFKAKVRLFGKIEPNIYVSVAAPELRFPECAEADGETKRCLQPYEGLAELWDDYCQGKHLRYPEYLVSLAKSERAEVRSVLDLACGTGTLTRHLLQIAPDVVGLDASAAMLAQAHSHSTDIAGIRYVQGDFRSFQLNQLFDAVICAFNSLNYVGDLAEFHAVLRCVAEHLAPRGYFLFDTFTEDGMIECSDNYFHALSTDVRFAIRCEYDIHRRKLKSIVLLPTGCEVHIKIPINPEDVFEACQGTGLHVEDYFSSPLLPGRWYVGPECVFVLRKAEG